MSESLDQMKLVHSSKFLDRVQYLVAQKARDVLGETGIGSTHATRAAYARLVLPNISSFAAVIAVVLVGGVNLIGTVVDDGVNPVDSSATDAAIFSQIGTFWNALSGVDSGN